MTARTPTGKTPVDKTEQVKQEIAQATDLNKLLKDNEFVKKLQTLPQIEQFKIFEQYKDKFIEISKDPGSAIAKWTGSFTKNLPNIDNAQNNLNNGIKQGQNLIQTFRNSLK